MKEELGNVGVLLKLIKLKNICFKAGKIFFLNVYLTFVFTLRPGACMFLKR